MEWEENIVFVCPNINGNLWQQQQELQVFVDALPFLVRDKVKIYQFKLFCGSYSIMVWSRGSSLSNSSPPSCSTGTKQAQCSKGVYLNLSVVWMGLWFYAMLWKWRVRSIFRFWKLFITVLHIRLQKLESLHQTFIQTHTHIHRHLVNMHT